MAERPALSHENYRRAIETSGLVAGQLATPRFLGISRTDRMTRAYADAIKTSRYHNMTSFSPRKKVKPGQLIGSPMPLCESQMHNLVGQADYSKYTVRLSMQITAGGHAKRVRVVESNAPATLGNLVAKLYGVSRFRPVVDAQGRAQKNDIEVTQTFAQPDATSNVFPHSDVATAHGCFALSRYFESRRDFRMAEIQ